MYVQSNAVALIDTVKKQEPKIQEIKPVTVKQLKSAHPEFDKATLCRSIKSDSELKQFMVSL